MAEFKEPTPPSNKTKDVENDDTDGNRASSRDMAETE